MKLTKADLIKQNAELQRQLEITKQAFDASIQGGLEFKRRHEEAYFLLKSIDGINSHPKWLEVQEYIKRFTVIDTPAFGKMVIPR